MDDHNVAIGFYPQGGDDPAPTAPTRTVTEERWGIWHPDFGLRLSVFLSKPSAEGARCGEDDIPIRVTLTYEVPRDPA